MIRNWNMYISNGCLKTLDLAQVWCWLFNYVTIFDGKNSIVYELLNYDESVLICCWVDQMWNPNLWWKWESFHTLMQETLVWAPQKREMLLLLQQNQERRLWHPFISSFSRQLRMEKVAGASFVDKAIPLQLPLVISLGPGYSCSSCCWCHCIFLLSQGSEIVRLKF